MTTTPTTHHPIQPINTGRGAATVKNGISFEKQLVGLLNTQTINSLTDNRSIVILENICKTLELNFNDVRVSIAHHYTGGRKADVILYLIFENHSTQKILISVKGVNTNTQFANINTEKMTAQFNHPKAAIAINKFMGVTPYDKEWQQEFGHENRKRYLLDELSLDDKKAIVELSAQKDFYTTILDSILGNEENPIHLIIAPTEKWIMNPSELLIINCEKTREYLDNQYHALPQNFLSNQKQYEKPKHKVVSTITKSGKLTTPNGEGGLRFADELTTLKRKGSEASAEKGFKPTDTQVICSALKLYKLLNP